MQAAEFSNTKDRKLHFDNKYMENPITFNNILLYQLGDLFSDANMNVGDHIQKCYEITYVVSGKGTFGTNNNKYNVTSGDIYLSVPFELHSGRSDLIDPYRYFYFAFNFINPTQEEIEIKNAFENLKRPVIKAVREIEDLFLKIFEEIISENKLSDEMIAMYLKQIIILTYRECIGKNLVSYTPKEKISEKKQMVYKAINYMECHFGNIENLSVIAEKLGYSYDYLSHVFTNVTGKSLREYYNQKIIEKAKFYLEKEQLNITEIATKLGYSSIYSFNKIFRKKVGMPPTEYRKIRKENHYEKPF